MTREIIYACAFICTPLSAWLGLLAWKEWREKRHAQDEHARALQITLDLTVALRDALANNKELGDMVKLDREAMQTAGLKLEEAEQERDYAEAQFAVVNEKLSQIKAPVLKPKKSVKSAKIAKE